MTYPCARVYTRRPRKAQSQAGHTGVEDHPLPPSSADRAPIILAGGGIGGLTTALALARRGLPVVVIEQSPAFTEVGAGLQLSANATRLLFALGLEDALRARAFVPEAAEVRAHATGAVLLRTRLGEAGERRWGAPYLQLHRADLHAVLAHAVAREPRVEIRLGARLVSFSQDDGVEATLENAQGTQRLRGAALIGCDGVRSAVRAALWGATPARFTGQMAWRGLAPADRLPAGLTPPAAVVWTGAGRHLVHYPVRAGALVNVVGFVEQTTPPPESWTEPGDARQFRADFAGWPEPVASLVRAVDQPWRYAIHDRPPLPRWSQGQVSLLGDAAHPAPPFLAQGAGMAIEDAEALAHHLGRHLGAGGETGAALLAYERERRARTARVQSWSRRNARLFHLPSTLAGPLFGAAALLDQATGRAAEARLDWLYGYRPAGLRSG